jgi:hypothetical protein
MPVKMPRLRTVEFLKRKPAKRQVIMIADNIIRIDKGILKCPAAMIPNIRNNRGLSVGYAFKDMN